MEKLTAEEIELIESELSLDCDSIATVALNKLYTLYLLQEDMIQSALDELRRSPAYSAKTRCADVLRSAGAK